MEDEYIPKSMKEKTGKRGRQSALHDRKRGRSDNANISPNIIKSPIGSKGGNIIDKKDSSEIKSEREGGDGDISNNASDDDMISHQSDQDTECFK